MDKLEITQALISNHQKFIDTVSSVSDGDFVLRPNGKWSTGQQLEHIIKSVRQVEKAFSLPLAVLETKFGLSKRPSDSYHGVVQNYLKVLKENPNYVLPEHFAPEEIPLEYKNTKIEELHVLVKKLSEHVLKRGENELDTYVLPHPVMGNLSLREVLYFKIYHVQHHEKQILPNLNAITNAKS